METFNELNPQQKEAVYSQQQRICVIAGPGCGKTKTLVTRVVHLVRNQQLQSTSILLLTFSKKAIREIKERLAKQLGRVSTFQLNIHNFHSFCYKQLQLNPLLFGFQKHFIIYDRSDQETLVKRILRDRSQPLTGRDFSDLMNNISLCKIRIGYSKVLERNHYEDFLIYKEYEGFLKKERALDFNDLLLYVLKGLRNATVREQVAVKFSTILVDEFQDVNDIQWEIVRLLANKQTNLFVVGDPNQSIYGFQGSSPELIASLISDHAWQKFFLCTNYRSSRNIVRISNLFLEQHRTSLVLNRLETVNQTGVPVEVIRNCSPRLVVRKILYLIETQRVGLSSIAVIYRSNYLSSFIEQELVSSGIPYEILGAFKFVEREEIKDILAYLKLVAFQNDISFLRILKSLTGIGTKFITKTEALSKQNNLSLFNYLRSKVLIEQEQPEQLRLNKLQKQSLLAIINALDSSIVKFKQQSTLLAFVNEVLQDWGYLSKLEQKKDFLQRKKNVQQLLNIIESWEKDYSEKKGLSLSELLSEFLHYCSISFEDSSLLPGQKKNIILSSIHQVKGLEFDFVFFLYLDYNILPHKMSTDLTEEKRIFYVGITRAKKVLYLVSNGNQPSPFLEILL